MTTEITLKLNDPAREVRELREAGFQDLADEIEAQLPKPKLEEPTEFGSIIRATVNGRRSLMELARDWGEGHWRSESRAVHRWDELTDVEVVRVGVGPTPEQVEYLIKEFATKLRMRAAEWHPQVAYEWVRDFADRLLGRGGA